MIPSPYSELKDNPSVDLIAEYPMLDPPRNFAFIFYLSYQAYHEVPMVNSAKTGSTSKEYRESLANLENWQTLGVLKRLGVDRVVVHGADVSKIRSPLLIKIDEAIDSQTTTPVASYKISDAVAPSSYVLSISDGFDGPSNYGFLGVEYFMHKTGVLKPTLLPGAEKKNTATARLEFYAFEKTPRAVDVIQDGRVITQVRPTEDKQIVEFQIDPSKLITIIPKNAPSDYSFVISNMEIK